MEPWRGGGMDTEKEVTRVYGAVLDRGYLAGYPSGAFTRDTVTIADLPSDFCDLTRDICRDKRLRRVKSLNR